ncbi:PQQ-binding-like beta-propeller repeat protein [Streptosporangium canum]|uniref:PQQ-binding-like beta-propeller repeat protein n=1 Tax=Streptosporangium canum TaxID=324952 RepID=UPI003F4DEE81
MRFSGLDISLVLADGWLYGTGTDRVVWLRDARSGQLHWRHSMEPVPSGKDSSHYPRLVVGTGQVFVGGGVGDPTGELISLCAADGRRMWRQVLPRLDEIARFRDMVVAVTDTSVHGMSAATGEVRWKTGVDGGGWRWMLPCGDTLLVGNSGVGVMALDGGDGQVRWSLTPSKAGLSDVTFEVSGDLVHVFIRRAVPEKVSMEGVGRVEAMTAVDGEVRTVSAATGRVRWSRTLPPLGWHTLAAGELLYLTSGARLLALHAETGKTAWSMPLPEPDLSPELRLHGGVLLVSVPVPDDDGLCPLLGLDPGTGAQRWRLGVKDPGQGFASGPPGVAFVTTSSYSARLLAIDVNAGEVIWSTRVKKDSELIADDDLVYAYLEHIDAYDIATGAPLSG